MEVLSNIDYSLSLDEVIENMHLRKLSDKIRKMVEDIYETVVSVAKPKAVYKEAYIDEIKDDSVVIEGINFKSRVLADNLRDRGRVYPHVVTVGNEVDKIEVEKDDFLKDYILDLIKELVLKKSREKFEEIMFKKFNIKNASYMSPGSIGDWPVSEQKKLFELLGDVRGAIGVELLPSFIMKPVKTVSGIYFLTDVDFKNCMLCPRKNCPSRKANFNPELYEKYYGKKI